MLDQLRIDDEVAFEMVSALQEAGGAVFRARLGVSSWCCAAPRTFFFFFGRLRHSAKRAQGELVSRKIENDGLPVSVKSPSSST